ncbi:protein PSK SIMULATOR 1-like isoform X1 [Carex rostrata]
MGGICSVCVRNSAVDKSPSDTTLGANTIRDVDLTNKNQLKLSSEYVETQFQEELVSSSVLTPDSLSIPCNSNVSDELPRLSRSFSQNSALARQRTATTKAGTKVPDIGSILGRAGTAGLGKAVEVLDTLGSSMTNLNLSNSGFVPSGTTKGSKVTILAFEVANTIVKGSNLMKSLSKESVKHIKEVVLASEGVQLLISKDMDELLRLTAADKREEFKVFSNEVVRFGSRCKDPQWHNLDRYFDKLASEITPQIHFKIEAEPVMQQLMAWAQCTAELYHEMHALDRFELDYRRMSKEENLTATQRGEHLQIIKQEVKSQGKLVKSLKKRSLWAKNIEEVMEKLVDIVHFLHLEICNAFGSADHEGAGNAPIGRGVRLGPAGLALHYANIISQIDTLVSRSSSIPANTRDALYQGLPPSVKSSLRSRLHSFQVKEELSVLQIKAEMEKTLRWLVPVANNTTKAHHGFGWVGEWANTGSEVNSNPSGQTELTLIETLHHADKSKTESFILDLIVWLHLLISQSKPSNGVTFKSPIKSPLRSPTKKGLAITAPCSSLSQEDQEMLQSVKFRKFIPGLSRSQELDTGKGKNKRLCKSNSQSPTTSSNNKQELFYIRRASMLPVIDFNINKVKAMDMVDRVDGLNVL